MQYTIDDLLRQVVSRGGSDLHLTVKSPPVIRIDSMLTPAGSEVLSPQDTETLIRPMMSQEQLKEFQEKHECDFAYSVPGTGRFRVNVFMQRSSWGSVIRAIAENPPDLDTLGLPQSVEKVCEIPKGLVLVTGPTGSGKTTTLAAIIDRINQRHSYHIVTIEDPIEYLHKHKKSLVNQREVGQDTYSFAMAVRQALRQDPDVILVGEMRDLETISAALTAAETGHLVFATLHTFDAPSTIDRIIDIFPPHHQQQVRIQLASTLQAVICQQLLPRKFGSGRAVACEVMLANTGIRTCIREAKIHQIPNMMETSKGEGQQLLKHSIAQLVQDETVSLESALAVIEEKELMPLINRW